MSTNPNPNRRYSISEVSKMIDVAPHLLRQWEARFPQLKPGRSPTGRRYYTMADIDIARRIKYLRRHEKMTMEGARIRLARELHGQGRPETRQEMIDLAEEIQEEIRAMLDLLDENPPPS